MSYLSVQKSCAALTALAAALLFAWPAAAEREGPPAPVRITMTPWSGALYLDARLHRYGWDTGPILQYGLAAEIGRGRWAAGPRVWRANTVQSGGALDTALSPDVSLSAIELASRVGVVRLFSVDVLATGSVGLLRIDYSPDHITYEIAGEPPIVVDLQAITEWTSGMGLAAHGPLFRSVGFDFSAERYFFGLQTNHRAGNSIVSGRETIASWTFRAGLTWHAVTSHEEREHRS